MKHPKALQTTPGLLIQAVIGVVLAYVFASRAIDTGSWIQYTVSFLLVVLSIKLIVRAIKK